MGLADEVRDPLAIETLLNPCLELFVVVVWERRHFFFRFFLGWRASTAALAILSI